MIGYIKKFLQNFREYIVLIILLIISLITISLNNSESVKTFRTVSFGYYAFINSIPTWISEIFNNNSEMEELRQHNAELMLQVNLLREYGMENFQLKEMLAFEDSTNFSLQPSKIISKFTTGTEGYYVLNKGVSDSILVGMPVISEKGLVGIITEVSEDFCVLRILINSKSKITVRNQRSGIDGIMAWDGTNLIIKNIPTTFDFKEGDRIVTSSFSVVAPPSIPVGIVSSKKKTAAGLLSNILMKPFVDFNSLKNVFILKIVPSRQIDNLELNLFK